jgi:HEAT repeat protein
MSWWTRQQLKFKNPETRRQAASKLAAEGTDEAVDDLVEALLDDDAGVRLVVVQALGRIKEPRTLGPLVQAMRDPDGEVREAVVGALMQVGDATCAEVLVGALKDLNLAVRRRAAQALDLFGWQPSNDIQKVLRLVALGEYMKAAMIGSPALEPLRSLLKDSRCPNRRSVVEALSTIGDERVLKPLIGALNDADPHVRVAAVEALGAIRDPRSAEPLTPLLKDPDPLVRAAVADALGTLTDNGSFDRLTASLKDSNWSVRKASVESLGRLKDARAVGPLVELLKDPDHDVREAAIEALGHIQHTSAVEHLVVALTDPQSSVRNLAAGVLRKIDDQWERSEAARQAIPALKAAATSKEYWVRQAAADTLSKLNELPRAEPNLNSFTDPVYYKRAAALQALAQALRDWDRDLRLAAAEALGRIADQRALEPLKAALDDEDEWVRESARQALWRMGWQPDPGGGRDLDPVPGETASIRRLAVAGHRY